MSPGMIETSVFDQFGIILKKRGVEQQITPVVNEPIYPEQLLKIGKPSLQDKHLVLDIGGAFLQQPCLGVYLAKKRQ